GCTSPGGTSGSANWAVAASGAITVKPVTSNHRAAIVRGRMRYAPTIAFLILVPLADIFFVTPGLFSFVCLVFCFFLCRPRLELFRLAFQVFSEGFVPFRFV